MRVQRRSAVPSRNSQQFQRVAAATSSSSSGGGRQRSTASRRRRTERAAAVGVWNERVTEHSTHSSASDGRVMDDTDETPADMTLPLRGGGLPLLGCRDHQPPLCPRIAAAARRRPCPAHPSPPLLCVWSVLCCGIVNRCYKGASSAEEKQKTTANRGRAAGLRRPISAPRTRTRRQRPKPSWRPNETDRKNTSQSIRNGEKHVECLVYQL